jgi:large subunit ribosomal protein L4
MQAELKTLDDTSAGTIELADEVFGLTPRPDILQRVVTWQLAKRRQGTHKVKGRSEVRATGAKLWRQKGTGRARHGSRRAPIFRGGGVAHGPQLRSHAIDLPKKVRKLGLKMALSSKCGAGELIVLDEVKLAEPRTGAFAKRLQRLGWSDVLIVDGGEFDANLVRAARNIVGVQLLQARGANVYDILRRAKLVLTRAAVADLEARLK